MNHERLYYWYKGASADRPGGPWWYRDFPNIDEQMRYYKDIKPFLKSVGFLSAGSQLDGRLPQHDPMDIKPADMSIRQDFVDEEER